MSDSTELNERYNRWQGHRITQLGVCISLFLTFSVATLGFSANLLVQHTDAIAACHVKIPFLFSVGLGMLSVALGSAACLTRLVDFRKTARIPGLLKVDKKQEADRLRGECELLGRFTWRLFYSQLATFILQAFLLIGSLGIAYWTRL